MKLIAKKPCGFGGKKFYIGDEIPAEYVLNPKTQEKLGNLVIVNDEAPGEVMEVFIHAAEGDMPLNLTKEGLQAVVDVITSKASEAKPIIEQMTDGDALILLHIADNRKEIKTAAENRAKAMSTEENPGENPEEPPKENPGENPEESAGEQ